MLDVEFLNGQEHHLWKLKVFFCMTIAYLTILNHKFNITFHIQASNAGKKNNANTQSKTENNVQERKTIITEEKYRKRKETVTKS